MASVSAVLLSSWTVLVAMAPYLLLGFLIAGLLSVLISAEWVERHLGRGTLGEIFKASLLGVPLPLCSCGVLPVAASIRRHGAGKGATTAFLLSTPQTGVDSVAITWALLGPVLAFLRPLIALVTGVSGGMAVRFFAGEEDGVDQLSGIVGRSYERETGQESTACSASCCGEKERRGPLILRALRYGLLDLPRDIGRSLFVGIILSGLISVFLKPGMLESAGVGGFMAYLLAMVVGIPLYVCATGSTPVAAGLISAGVSPGAALVFLISGPATNMAALATLVKILGKKATLLYLSTVVLFSLGAGIFVDFLLGPGSFSLPVSVLQNHHRAGFGFSEICALLLIALLLAAFSSGRTGKKEERRDLELEIHGMRCAGCSSAVERNLLELEGVESVRVDLDSGAALLRGADFDAESACEIVRSLGYEVTRTSHQ